MRRESLDPEKLKASVIKNVEAHRDELKEMSLKIHSNPEIAFEEVKASGWLTQCLEKNGFTIERGICELPTAFRASYGHGKPVIGFLSEYDALPGLGHACGHNLICTTAVGAALASKLAVDELGGSILVIGTPAEEKYGGKAIMAERGAFDNLDVAMIVHPKGFNAVTRPSLVSQDLEVQFFGKAAHAASKPWEGINALDAMLLSIMAINSLRQHIKDKARIHGIITKSGEVSNAVPAYSAGTFKVRAEDEAYHDELKQRVLNCFIGAATATGARLEYKWPGVRRAPMRSNLTLAQLFIQNMQPLGREMQLAAPPEEGIGSTDVSNVSQLVPTLYPYVAIAPLEVLGHSPDFAAAAASEAGIRGMLDAAKALAMTVVDLLANPKLISQVKQDFARQTGLLKTKG